MDMADPQALMEALSVILITVQQCSAQAFLLHSKGHFVAHADGIAKLTRQGEQLMQHLLREISALTFLIDTGNLSTELVSIQGKLHMGKAIFEYPAGRARVRKGVICQKCSWPWFPRSDPTKKPPPQCPQCKNEPMEPYVDPQRHMKEQEHHNGDGGKNSKAG